LDIASREHGKPRAPSEPAFFLEVRGRSLLGELGSGEPVSRLRWSTPLRLLRRNRLERSEENFGEQIRTKTLLIIGNCFWSGVGNLIIGDSRGWFYGYFNWIPVIAAILTNFASSEESVGN
jgi:hypothetical protein